MARWVPLQDRKLVAMQEVSREPAQLVGPFPPEPSGAVLAAELTPYTVYLLRQVLSRFTPDGTARSARAREFVVLSVLAEVEGLSQQELGERLDINRTVIVKLIDKLEQAGQVVRRRNPVNRRSYLLSVTAKGRAELAAMQKTAGEFDQDLAPWLAPEELPRLKQLLIRVHPESGRSTAGLSSAEYLIAQTFYALRREGDGELAEFGLRLRHFGPLLAVDKFGPCPQHQLSRYLARPEPATATLVEELVRADLVWRGQDAVDRRRYALELTDLGHDRLVRVRAIFDRMQGRLVALLGPDDDADLRVLLGKLMR